MCTIREVGRKAALARPGAKLPVLPVSWRSHSIDFFFPAEVCTKSAVLTFYHYDRILEEMSLQEGRLILVPISEVSEHGHVAAPLFRGRMSGWGGCGRTELFRLHGGQEGRQVETKCSLQGQVSVTYSLQLTSPPTVSGTSQLLRNLWTLQRD